jgi:hypothetical protein
MVRVHKCDSYSITCPNANLIYNWSIIFLQTRLWRPSHGDITITTTLEELSMHMDVEA